MLYTGLEMKENGMKNWRTMLGGFLGAISVPLIEVHSDPMVHWSGIALAMIAATWFGYQAADAKAVKNQIADVQADPTK